MKIDTTNLFAVFKYYAENGIISFDDIMNSEKEELMNEIVRKLHKAKISQGSDERWQTYVPDPDRPSGRKLVRLKEKKDLIKYLACYYKVQEDKSRMKFEDLFFEWVDYKRQFIGSPNNKKSLSPTTIRRYEREYEEYIKGLEVKNKKLSGLAIGDVTTPDLMLFMKQMIKENGMLDSCAGNVLGYVRGAFHYARKQRYIMEDPAEDMDRDLLLAQARSPQPKLDSERVLTQSEIVKLIKSIREHLVRHPLYLPDFAILFSLLTGMRVGEISALKWSDVDLNAGVIHITKSEHRLDYSDKPSELVIGAPKNGKIRDFPLTTEILKLLNEIHALGLKSPEDFIFVREDGRRYTGHDIGCAASRRAKEAGIGKTSIHEIRRTLSSLLNDKLPRPVVSEMFGHSPEVNAGHYDYSTAENREKTKALGEVYSKVFMFETFVPDIKNTENAIS